MTDDRLPLLELLEKAGDDCFRSVAESVLQVLMEADVEGLTDRSTGSSSRRCSFALLHSITGPASDSTWTVITFAI